VASEMLPCPTQQWAAQIAHKGTTQKLDSRRRSMNYETISAS